MASNILSIGQSALAAAQVEINVTGHNIANVSTPGYSRQVAIQSSAQAQNFGYGYVGQGTQITAIQRVYSDLLAVQVTNAQTNSNELNTYATQMTQIDNLLADSSAGLAPAIQDFFKSIQAASTNPGDSASRQSVLSTAQALASRFQGMGELLDQIGQDVNSQLTSSVYLVNSYAQQIAKLNDAIEIAQSINGNPPNDLMDQRDQVISDLSKQIKATVVQDGSKYNVFIGNGLPLVVGTQTYPLSMANSPTDAGRLEVSYLNNNGKPTILGSSSLSGGTIGGLLQFREKSLDNIQSQLGLLGVAISATFNQQHQLGVDSAGNAGGQFFTVAAPSVTASTNNTGTATTTVAISNVSALTGSNYRLKFDGTNYTITRLDNGTAQTFPSLPQTLDGLDFSITAGAVAGDSFLIKPTAQGATSFSVAINNVSKIALGGTPSSGPGDNRNALLLAGLQTTSTMLGSTTSYEGAYGQLVSMVGNKTNELQVMGKAETEMLSQAVASQQSVSGVNLDEEATNLLRYQQAYQAAGKVMQIASQMFDVLLHLGG